MQSASKTIANRPWLTDWDERMIGYLDTMAVHKAPPKLQLLFFANTFPLAYHYALALKIRDKNPSAHIHLGLWKKGKDKDVVQYTNAQTSGHEGLKAVTLFNPRWVFVPLTLSTSRIWESTEEAPGDSNSRPLAKFLEAAKKADYDTVWIYSELKDLGQYLAGLVKKDFPKPSVFFSQEPLGRVPWPAMEVPNPDRRLLRLFIFGGSLSSYLLGKRNRYLALALEDKQNNLPNEMRLFVSSPPEWTTALSNYHSALYRESLESYAGDRNPQCPPFFTVYRSYNELAWLFQHRSSFRNANDYAQCLRDHHADEAVPKLAPSPGTDGT